MPGVSRAGECEQVRELLGVYLLGAIEPGERARVDRHLASCTSCREELAGLAGLPGLLRAVAADETMRAWIEDGTEPLPASPPERLLRQVTRIRRRRRRAAAVAAAVLAAAAAAGGLQAFAAHPAGQPVASHWAAEISGASAATGARAEVRYRAQPWGTELQVQVTGIRGGTRCQLVVTGPHGLQVAAGGWTIAASSPQAWYPASAALRPGSLRSFAVSADGKTLVTIPARSATASPAHR